MEYLLLVVTCFLAQNTQLTNFVATENATVSLNSTYDTESENYTSSTAYETNVTSQSFQEDSSDAPTFTSVSNETAGTTARTNDPTTTDVTGADETSCELNEPIQTDYLPSKISYLRYLCQNRRRPPECPEWKASFSRHDVDITISTWRPSYDKSICLSEVRIYFPPGSGLFSRQTVIFSLQYLLPGLYESDVHTIKVKQSGNSGPCWLSKDCYVEKQWCIKEKCACPSYFQYFPRYEECLQKKWLGDRCTKNEECQMSNSRSYCSYQGLCSCQYPYKPSGGECLDTDPGNGATSSKEFPWKVTLIPVIVFVILVAMSCMLKKNGAICQCSESSPTAVPNHPVCETPTPTPMNDDPPSYLYVVSADKELPPPTYLESAGHRSDHLKPDESQFTQLPDRTQLEPTAPPSISVYT